MRHGLLYLRVWEGRPVWRHIARRSEAAREVAVQQHSNLRTAHQVPREYPENCLPPTTQSPRANDCMQHTRSAHNEYASMSADGVSSLTVKLNARTASSVTSPSMPPCMMSPRVLDMTAHQDVPTTASTMRYMILPRWRSHRRYRNASQPAMLRCGASDERVRPALAKWLRAMSASRCWPLLTSWQTQASICVAKWMAHHLVHSIRVLNYTQLMH